MYIKFDKKQDLIDFILETYTNEADIQFENWDCINFELNTLNLSVVANTEYYDFGKKYNIHFNSKGTNSFLYKMSTLQNYVSESNLQEDINDLYKNKYIKICDNYISTIIANTPTADKDRLYLKQIFIDFINKNANYNFNIKLKYPSSLQKTFDKNNQYDSFCMDFFSDGINHGVFFTYNENTKKAEIEAPIEWTTFCYNIYLQFLENKKNSKNFYE